jgi:hypothetical protein
MKKNLTVTICIAVFVLAACQPAAPVPTSTPQPQPTETSIPTSTPQPTPTPITWLPNTDNSLNPPLDEHDAIEKAYKKFLTAYMVLEDVGNDPMKYPAADEKKKLLAESPIWAPTQGLNGWFIGEYKSFDVRCFNEQTCEAAYTIHITGMILGESNCKALGVSTTSKGTCWLDPVKNKGIWQNMLQETQEWYDRTLMVKMNNQWYATAYSSYSLNPNMPTPTAWSPK